MLNKDFATEVKVAQEACQQIRIALYIGLVSRARNEKMATISHTVSLYSSPYLVYDWHNRQGYSEGTLNYIKNI